MHLADGVALPGGRQVCPSIRASDGGPYEPVSGPWTAWQAVVACYANWKDSIMDQLTAFVSQKTGLSQDQANQAAQAVIDFLKSKLPGPIASQLDSVLSGGGASGAMDQAKGMLGGLGGMLGGGGNQS